MRPKINGKSLRPAGYARRGNALQPGSSRAARGAELLMNMDIVRRPGRTEELLVSDNRATLCLRREIAKAEKPGAHPFKVYKVSESGKRDEDKGKTCYAVRSGMIELRSKWKDFAGSAGLNNISNRGNLSYYDDIDGDGPDGDEVGAPGEERSDGVGITDVPAGKLGVGGGYFVLDDIDGVDQETNDGGARTYGCYYSFWLEISDYAPNEYPICKIKCQRFSAESGPVYTPVAFPAYSTMADKGVGCPAPVDDDDFEFAVEAIPIAILQLLTGNALGGGGIGLIEDNQGSDTVPPAIYPVIMQLQRDHLINRFDINRMRYVGEYNPRQHRTYYPGDLVSFYAAGDNTNPGYGRYLCFAPYTNGAAETGPTGAAFIYFANINPPSATNPP